MGSWLSHEFSEPHRALSWAIVGGGWRQARRVVWHQVCHSDLAIDVDPIAFFEDRLQAAGFSSETTVGLLTSATLSDHVEIFRSDADLEVRCLATVGMGNALRIGDPVRSAAIVEKFKVGTINLLLQTSCPLSLNASIEAASLVAEARTLAVLNARLPSRVTGRDSTGTGTDCTVIASPDRAPAEIYSGKHTRLGALIGQTVEEAVSEGIKRWLIRKRGRESAWLGT